MKKIRGKLVVVLIMLSMFLVGAQCNEDITTYAYQSLNASAAAYNLARVTVIDLYKTGYLNDEQKTKAINLSKQYNDAYQLAVAALKTYEQTKGDAEKGGLTSALTNASLTLADLTKYLQPYLEKREGQ